MTDALKTAVQESGQSLYAISAATGLNKSALGRFMASRQSLRLDMADRLASHLGLHLVSAGRKER